jgi:hypothetical protein
MGFVVNEEALRKVLSEYFDFLYQSFHRLLHTQHHPPSGAGTDGPIAASVTLDWVPLNLTPPALKNTP